MLIIALQFMLDDFAQKTGYHSYEPMLGLGAFKLLVCLITQFLLELRETYPAGLLTWGGVVVVALPLLLYRTPLLPDGRERKGL